MPRRGSKKPKAGFDRTKVERAVKLLLEGVGEKIPRAGLGETPRRVCNLYEEILSGTRDDPARYLKPIKAEHNHDLVVVKSIAFTSVCEHHLLPFIGTVGVAYVPRGRRIVGISKIVRAVDAIAHRLQIQERMTSEIAGLINRELKPSGVYVIVDAEHLCMTIRGVKKPGARIVTTEARGILKQPERQALVVSALSG
jgi:GTP cyclohydrolase I